MPYFSLIKNSIYCILITICAFFFISEGSSEQTLAQTTTPEKPAITHPSYQSGLKALKNNLPDIAINHFKKALASGPAKNKEWDHEQNTLIRQYLAESYTRAGKSTEALELYSQLPMSPENNYWTAIALIRQGFLTKALHWLNQVPENTPFWGTYVLQAKAFVAEQLNDSYLLLSCLEKLVASTDQNTGIKSRIWLANAYIKQNEISKASELIRSSLESLSSENSTYVPYFLLLQSAILTEEHNWVEAKQKIASIMEIANLPVKLQDLAQLTLASIEIEEAKYNSDQTPKPAVKSTGEEEELVTMPNNGEDQLIAFISRRPDSPLISEAFTLLMSENIFATNPQAMEKLVSWSKQSDQSRQPLASYALAETLLHKKELEQALEITEQSLSKTPNHPATKKLAIQMINYLVQQEKYDEAERLIRKYPHKDAEIYFNSGIIAFENKDYEQAGKHFSLAIDKANEGTIRQAYYNAILNALELGDTALQEKLIKDAFLMPELQEHLAYEQAHYSARNHEPQAMERLEQFISYYPSSPLRIKAMLDLGELALNIAPPKVDVARDLMAKLESMELDAEEARRLDILNILVPESQFIWPEAITACRNALNKHSSSEQADQLQLKLGELLFKNEQFNEALLVLQSFEEKFPSSPLKNEALFLAGLAAQQSNTEATLLKALSIFQTIAAEKNEYSQQAIIRLSSILQRRGQTSEAISTLQELLNQNPPRQIRLKALSIQAEAWSSLNDDEEGTAMKTARDLCTQILETPNLLPSWRFSALSQRAQYAEKTGDSDAALDDYYAILSYFSNNGNKGRSDWYWYYDAGFAALNILETKQEWEKALALAEKMSQSKGPRARDARTKARKIQYEHFIWNDTGEKTVKDLKEEFFTPPPASSDNSNDTVDQPEQQTT